MKKTTRSDTAIDILVISLIFGALYHQYLFMGKTIPTGIDIPIYTQPTTVFTANSLLEGTLPLWNPYWFSGFPHLAAPRMGVFYPTTVLFAIRDFGLALKIDTLCHVFLMGVFSYLLGRNLYRDRLVALALALLTISGALILSIFFLGHIFALHTLTYIPLSLLFIRQILATRKLIWVIGLALTTMLQIFGGDVQILSYMLFTYGLYTLAALGTEFWTDASKHMAFKLLHKGSLCLIGVLWGVLCAAVQLLPTWELLNESIRSEPVSESFMTASAFSISMYWKDLLHLDMHLEAFNQYLPFISAALSPALLLVAFGGRERRNQFIFLGIFIICVIWTIMPDIFLRYIILNTPILNKGRLPFRLEFCLIFIYYILVCFGLRRLVRWNAPEGGARLWQPYTLIAVATCTLAVIQQSNMPELRPLLALEAIFILSLAAVVFLKRRSPRWTGVCLLLLLVFEGNYFVHHRLRTYPPFSEPVTMYAVDDDYLAFSKERTGLDRVALFSPGLWDRPLRQASGMLTGDRTFGGYHGLLLKRTVNFAESVAGLKMLFRTEDGKLIREDPIAYSQDWVTEESYAALDLLNVRYLVSKNMRLATPHKDALSGKRFVLKSEHPLLIYENTQVYPVAFTVHNVRIVDQDEEALKLLADPNFEHRETIILTEDFNRDTLRSATHKEPVEILEYGINHVDLAVVMTAPGILVLTDTYYPGWKATVDGTEDAHVYCVDTILRGVFLDEGAHEVHFYFLPKSFILGAVMSCAALLAVLTCLCLLLFRAHRPEPQSKDLHYVSDE